MASIFKQFEKIDSLESKILNVSAMYALFTFMVVKETGVLPICPTTTENGVFWGSSASILVIFFSIWPKILRTFYLFS